MYSKDQICTAYIKLAGIDTELVGKKGKFNYTSSGNPYYYDTADTLYDYTRGKLKTPKDYDIQARDRVKHKRKRVPTSLIKRIKARITGRKLEPKFSKTLSGKTMDSPGYEEHAKLMKFLKNNPTYKEYSTGALSGERK